VRRQGDELTRLVDPSHLPPNLSEIAAVWHSNVVLSTQGFQQVNPKPVRLIRLKPRNRSTFVSTGHGCVLVVERLLERRAMPMHRSIRINSHLDRVAQPPKLSQQEQADTQERLACGGLQELHRAIL